jgi:peroxiredoxin
MSLQDRLDAFKADFEGRKAPPGVVEVARRATAALVASGQAGRALHVGARAPEFALPDPTGQLIRSAELIARGPLVITFYRGVWCPYCNMDLLALEEASAEIRACGATIVAISPQSAVSSRKAVRDMHLSFPILTDFGGQVAHAFGLRFRLPDELIALYKSFGNDLSVTNGEPSWTLPMPARYIVGTEGVIAYAEINPDYTQRPDPSELLPVLHGLADSPAAPASYI